MVSPSYWRVRGPAVRAGISANTIGRKTDATGEMGGPAGRGEPLSPLGMGTEADPAAAEADPATGVQATTIQGR